MGETVVARHSDRGSTPLRSIGRNARRNSCVFLFFVVNDIDICVYFVYNHPNNFETTRETV